jgi:sporulation protein YunB
MRFRKFTRISVILLAALVMVGGLLLILVEHNIKPILLSMAETRVRAIALDAINKSVPASFEGITYQDLIKITYDEGQYVSSLEANASLMNKLASTCAITAQQYITDIEMQPIRVSLGSATGIQLLIGRGPSVLVKVEPVGSVNCDFYTQFSSAGINQTRHRIFMNITAMVRVIIPTGSKPMEVTNKVLIAETVIVGRTPQSFVDVDDEGLLDLLPSVSE